MVSYDPIDEMEMLTKKEKEKENGVVDEKVYALHLPKEFDVMVVVVNMLFQHVREIRPEHRLKVLNMKGGLWYTPPVDLGQPFHPTINSLPLAYNSSNSFNLSIYPQSY